MTDIVKLAINLNVYLSKLLIYCSHQTYNAEDVLDAIHKIEKDLKLLKELIYDSKTN